MIVKICGLTRPEDAAFAAQAGADWLGLNFWPRSRRVVTRDQAVEVAQAARAARPSVALCGVFVDQPIEQVLELVGAVGLDFVQLHGDEPPEYVERLGKRAIKVVPLASPHDLDLFDDYSCATFLVDTPSPGRGGSGELGDWELARRAAELHRVILAGGLTPDNVAAAVAAVAPYGVDAASGVESTPGRKEARLVERFVAAARAALAARRGGGVP
ncbi:MAG TPA: phosphoribosylanthranilate isomerase [Kofleriaceae bacterium]|nr:phosphoribosylanthranilate isomerase [Kofleriaceae bacterium]